MRAKTMEISALAIITIAGAAIGFSCVRYGASWISIAAETIGKMIAE